jgi:5-methyltetrahydropteroyltriglutamate--homocysteine methyltransferase
VKRSENRILTTHAGSLPRPPKLVDLFVALSKREPVDKDELAEEVRAATVDAVRNQREAGIDVGNDGEQSRESFFTYVQHRLSGYGGQSARPIMRDILFPTFLDYKMPDFSRKSVTLMQAPMAVGEVSHATLQPLRDECDGFEAALNECGGGFAKTFMTAASPGIVCAGMLNDHYPSDDDYVAAVADALRPEYEHIVSRGHILQLDCPDLAMERHGAYADHPLEDFQACVRRNIAAINRAIEGIPRDRVRMHVCWGNYEGPHHLDVPLEDVLPLFYEANAGALLLPFANPRHQHEWRALMKYPPPHDWLVIAGVIDTTTNYVEHPEVVADRIELVASAVGDPRRVLAGTDCGFGTAAGFGEVAPGVVWEKLRSLRAGADLATKRLLG